jgi:hypothetical protein
MGRISGGESGVRAEASLVYTPVSCCCTLSIMASNIREGAFVTRRSTVWIKLACSNEMSAD